MKLHKSSDVLLTTITNLMQRPSSKSYLARFLAIGDIYEQSRAMFPSFGVCTKSTQNMYVEAT
jgi:hypothetical protein